MSLVSLARHGRSVAVASCVLLLLPSVAMAKPGGGKSSGSRGERTYQAPPSTNTAPSAAQPLQRSATPAPAGATPAGAPAAARPATAAPAAGAAAAAAQAAKPSFARNMMMGIGAGLLGAGIFGLLSGSGLFSGLGGLASFFGLLMQVALIGGLVWLALRFFRRRQENQMAPAGANLAGMAPVPMAMAAPHMARESVAPAAGAGAGGAAAMAAPTVQAGSDTVGLTAEDFGVFERILTEVNVAYSNEDLAALQRYATPEMIGYFADDLRENAGRGVIDRTADVKLLQGDLAEAWVEGDVAYSTVAMRFESINTLADRKTGKVVEGNATIPQQSTELWTFACRRGDSWKVSAIQQPN